MHYFLVIFKRIDKTLFILPLLFASISLVVIASITYDGTHILNNGVKTQFIAFIIGYFLIGVILFLDYNTFEKSEKSLYVFALLLMLIVYTSLGYEQFGSKAWIKIGSLTMQPSEISKVLFILAFAKHLTRNQENLTTLQGILKAFLYTCPIVLIIIKEDLGSGVGLCIACVVMVFYAGANGVIFAKIGGIFLLTTAIIYRFLDGYQKNRIDAFLHPDNLAISGNWHIFQSKVAIGSGGIFGKGLFSGTQTQLNYLPVAKSDFIFAVIVEELGFIFAAVLLLLFTILLVRIWKIAVRAKDLYGSLVTIGVLSIFFFYIFENIGMTMGAIPATGVPLPFISLGGTSVIANMISLGLVLNIGIRNKMINF